MSSNNIPEVFFHVGLPKTASTFLQRNVFPVFEGVEFIKKHDFFNHEKIIASAKYPKVILSIELNLDMPNGFAKMETIAKKYPNAKPIVVFRKHGAWVGSKYKYYLRKHGTFTFEQYFDTNNDSGVLKNEHLEFFSKIKTLEEHYHTRPLVMFQEEFKKNPVDAVKVIANFTGAGIDKKNLKISTVKKSYSEHSLYYVRKLNRWYQYNPKKYKNKHLQIFYKKMSGALLHTTALYSGLFEPSKDRAKKVLPPDAIAKINEQYADDWHNCLEYAGQDRQLLL